MSERITILSFLFSLYSYIRPKNAFMLFISCYTLSEQRYYYMKKKIILTSVFTLLAILVFPVRYSLKDGGSVQYRSFTYEITKVHSLIPEEENKKNNDMIKPYHNGLIIKILGCQIYRKIYE